MATLPQPQRGEGRQAYLNRLASAGFEVASFESSVPDIGRGETFTPSGDYPLRPGVPGVGQAGGPQDAARLRPGETSFGGILPITSASITPQADISKSLTYPATIPTPTIPDFTTPELQETPKEKEISELIKRIRGTQEGLKGEAQYRAEEEQRQGLPSKIQTVNDLTNQLNTLKAQAAAVPLQLEQGAERRGITTTILGRQEQALLRQNAIQALTISALLQAAQGNLATAQDLIDRAVKAKFDPVREQINIDLTNLELLSKDPSLTREQENRLNKQKDAKETQKRAVDLAEDNQKKIWDIALKAAQNGADALTLRQIQNATTPELALEIVTQAGFVRKPEKIELGTTFGGGQISNQTQAIIDNPSLFDDLTPTIRGRVIGELQAAGYDTSNLGIKGLSDTAIKEISQTQKALSDLGDLRTIILNNQQYIGPIRGWQVLNPWSKSRKVQADINRVKQTVGKALEGGVLRKEDEEKYKKILATLLDTPETAIYKVDALLSSIQRDMGTYKSLQQSGGRSLNINAPLQKSGEPVPPEFLRTKYNY